MGEAPETAAEKVTFVPAIKFRLKGWLIKKGRASGAIALIRLVPAGLPQPVQRS
jgi:hypothetical protein